MTPEWMTVEEAAEDRRVVGRILGTYVVATLAVLFGFTSYHWMWSLISPPSHIYGVAGFMCAISSVPSGVVLWIALALEQRGWPVWLVASSPPVMFLAWWVQFGGRP